MGVRVKKLKRGDEQITIVDQQIHVGEIRRGHATMNRWINAVKAAERLINPDRKPLLDIYKDIDIDGHLRSIQDKRIRAVSTQPFSWGEDLPDAIRENFESPWFYNMQRQMMDYIFKGHQLIELDVQGGLIVDTEPVPRTNVRPEKQIITFSPYGYDGFDYTEQPTCDYVMEIGKPKDLGLYQHLAPYVLMKRDNLAFWMTFNEMFGMPMRVYYYDAKDKTSRQQTIEQAKSQGAAAYIVLPESSKVEFQNAQAASASSTGGFKTMHDTLNQEMTITVLGQTLTTSSDGKGSYALGGIHKAVEEGVNLEDMLLMEYMLNYIFKPIAVKHGYPIEKLKGTYLRTEQLSQEKKFDLWSKAKKDGLPIADEDFYSEFDIPSADEREVSMPPNASSLSGGEGEDIKGTLDAYGVGVRAGAITPQVEDEDHFREKLGTPKANSSVKETWSKDGGTRRPITLKPQEVIEDEIDKGNTSAKKDEPANDDEAKKKRLASLYASFPTIKGGGGFQLSYKSDLKKIMERIIQQLYDREITSGMVDQELFELTASELWKGVEKGYKTKLDQLTPGTPEHDLLLKLREDIYVFSGFKNYQLLQDASKLLINSTGEIRTFSEFSKMVLDLNDQYNINWLRSEYNMAVANTDMARKWLKFEEQKELFPLLSFRSVIDDRARHVKWNHITRPVDDPIWDFLTPPLDWGCRCTLQQLAEGKQTPKSKLPKKAKVKDEFAFNPGKEKVVFPPNHPYYKVDQRDQQRANSLFGLDVPDI